MKILKKNDEIILKRVEEYNKKFGLRSRKSNEKK